MLLTCTLVFVIEERHWNTARAETVVLAHGRILYCQPLLGQWILGTQALDQGERQRGCITYTELSNATVLLTLM